MSQEQINVNLLKSLEAMTLNITEMSKRLEEMVPGVHNNYLPKIKLNNPKVYDGCRDALIIDEWVRSVEMHQEFYNLNPAQTLLFASSHLSGRANAWYRNVEKQTDAPTTWDGFKQILLG
ncbi:hypothetical protein BD770DRAFT_396039 [Pilaira anomala]|nr:hypothetical protein BD770DRAFT_396039 [Pilaira anomala]